MTSIADSSVIIQTSSESVPSTPCWLGEVVLIVEHLCKQGVLAAIDERVRFARRHFGHYEVIDFLAVLFSYAISGERTLEAFYERLARLRGDLHGLVQPGAVAQPLGAQSLSRPPFPLRLLKPCVRSFWRICSLVRSPRSGREANCWIEQGESGRSSTSMAPERPPANVPCRRWRSCPLPSVAWMRSVLLATPGASVGKLSVW